MVLESVLYVGITTMMESTADDLTSSPVLPVRSPVPDLEFGALHHGFVSVLVNLYHSLVCDHIPVVCSIYRHT